MEKRSTKSRYAVLPGDPTLDYPYTLPYGLLPQQGVLVPDEEKAVIVTMIFERAAQGDTPAQIAERLKAEKVEPPAGADEWTPEAIEAILSNPVYVGEWGGVGRVEKPLIDAQLFSSAQPSEAGAAAT